MTWRHNTSFQKPYQWLDHQPNSSPFSCRNSNLPNPQSPYTIVVENSNGRYQNPQDSFIKSIFFQSNQRISAWSLLSQRHFHHLPTLSLNLWFNWFRTMFSKLGIVPSRLTVTFNQFLIQNIKKNPFQTPNPCKFPRLLTKLELFESVIPCKRGFRILASPISFREYYKLHSYWELIDNRATEMDFQ